MKNITPKKSYLSAFRAIASLLAVFSVTIAQADVVAQFPLENNSPSSVATLPHVDVTDFVLGAGLLGGSAGIGGAQKSLWAGANKTQSSAATALSANSYFSFTVSVGEGYLLNLSELSFGTLFNGTDAPAQLTGYFFVRSSLDNFASDIATSFSENYVTTNAFTSRTIDLSAAEFQNISETVEFRFYINDNSGASGRYMRINEVTLQGTVTAIPEAGTTMALLAAAAMFSVIGLRRLRNRKA